MGFNRVSVTLHPQPCTENEAEITLFSIPIFKPNSTANKLTWYGQNMLEPQT